MKVYKKDQVEEFVYEAIMEKLNDTKIFNEIAVKVAEATNKESQDTTKQKALLISL